MTESCFVVRPAIFNGWPAIKRVAFGLTGLTLGALFLWLALHDISTQELAAAVAQVDCVWTGCWHN